MGENKNNIKVIGAPGLENYKKLKFDKKIFNQAQSSRKKFILVTLNSYLSKSETVHFANILFRDLDNLNIMKIVTFPNPDINNQIIIDKIDDRADRSDYKIFKYLGSNIQNF